MAKKPLKMVRRMKEITLTSRIAEAIAEAGGDPDMVLRKILTEDADVISVMHDVGRCLAALSPGPMALLRAEFNGIWDDRLTDKNFPGMDACASFSGIRQPMKIMRPMQHEQDVLSMLADMNLRFSRLDASIRWCAAHPDYQRAHRLLCFAEHDVDGVESVVYFSGGARRRRVFLAPLLDKWWARNEIFVEEMTQE